MRDQILVMDRLLNRTGGLGYIYCLKVVIQLLPMLFVILAHPVTVSACLCAAHIGFQQSVSAAVTTSRCSKASVSTVFLTPSVGVQR